MRGIMPRASILALSLALAPVAAAETLGGAYEGVVEEVIDGDSMKVRVTIWLGQEAVTIVRLAGVDAAELKARCPAERLRALAARGALTGLAGGRRVTLTEVTRDKYGGRVVARVADEAGRDLGAAMISAGLARPYGARRESWCGLE